MEYILMSRESENIVWGFKLQGGVDFYQRLSIQKVRANSPASTSGLRNGDWLININGVNTKGFTHKQAVKEIKTCRNLTLCIQRFADHSFNSEAQTTSPLLGGLGTAQQDSSDITQTVTSSICVNCQSSVIDVSMNGDNQPEIPDQLLNQFGQSKHPEDKPFSYIPTGGIAELQQRSTESAKQRETAPPRVKPKPRASSRQGSYAGSETSQTSYDSASLFTPAYREMMKSQQELRQQSLPSAVPAEMVGFGAGKIPHEDVAAYILQPDGTMAAIRPPSQSANRWNDKPGPNLQNSAVMSALLEEQNAQMHGTTSGRIRSASGGSKQGLSFRVLQWLTGTDSEDNSETTSNYSGSHDGIRQRHPTCDSQNLQETIHEEDSACSSDAEYLYSGSKLPSKSFRRLLRSVSSTTMSTDEMGSLPSPGQEPEATTQNVSRNRFVVKTSTQPQQPEPCAYSDL